MMGARTGASLVLLELSLLALLSQDVLVELVAVLTYRKSTET